MTTDMTTDQERIHSYLKFMHRNEFYAACNNPINTHETYEKNQNVIYWIFRVVFDPAHFNGFEKCVKYDEQKLHQCKSILEFKQKCGTIDKITSSVHDYLFHDFPEVNITLDHLSNIKNDNEFIDTLKTIKRVNDFAYVTPITLDDFIKVINDYTNAKNDVLNNLKEHIIKVDYSQYKSYTMMNSYIFTACVRKMYRYNYNMDNIIENIHDFPSVLLECTVFQYHFYWMLRDLVCIMKKLNGYIMEDLEKADAMLRDDIRNNLNPETTDKSTITTQCPWSHI